MHERTASNQPSWPNWPRLSSYNPAAIAARGELAAIDEELADLKISGGNWSETLGMTGEQLVARKKDLEAFNTATAENEKYTKAAREEITSYIGDGLLNLDSALAKSKLSHEQQVSATQLAAGAYRAIATDDIPGFLRALDKIRTDSPATADAVVKELGPEMVRKLKANEPLLRASGTASGTALADALDLELKHSSNRITATGRGIIGDAEIGMTASAVSGGFEVGNAMAAGVAAGLAAERVGSAVSAAARDVVKTAIGAMKAEARTDSPSKETAEKIGIPLAEGIIVGMESRLIEVSTAGGGLITATAAVMEAEMILLQANMDVATKALALAVATGIDAVTQMAHQKVAALDAKLGQARTAAAALAATAIAGASGPGGIGSPVPFGAGGSGDGSLGYQYDPTANGGKGGYVPTGTSKEAPSLFDANGNLIGQPGKDWIFDPTKGGWHTQAAPQQNAPLTANMILEMRGNGRARGGDYYGGMVGGNPAQQVTVNLSMPHYVGDEREVARLIAEELTSQMTGAGALNAGAI